jgi:predicted GIY-YIG superfamily endonuclease
VKSTDIEELSDWESWPHPARAKAPETPGVYIFRLSNCFGRMQGTSDIVYIGLAKKNIKRRLADHRHTAIGLFANSYRDLGDLQVAWKSYREQSEAMVMESRLLGKHRREHMELPPLNRQQPLKELQQFFKAAGQLINRPVDDEVEGRLLGVFGQLEKAFAARAKPNP